MTRSTFIPLCELFYLHKIYSALWMLKIAEFPMFCFQPNVPIVVAHPSIQAFLVAQMLKNLPAIQETRVRPLGWEDPLKKEIATPLWYSCHQNSTDRGEWRATVHGVSELDMTECLTHTHTPFHPRAPLHVLLPFSLRGDS